MVPPAPFLSTKYHSSRLSPPIINLLVAQAITSCSQEDRRLCHHRNHRLASVQALHMPIIMDQPPTGHIRLNTISLRLHRPWACIPIRTANIRLISRSIRTMKVIQRRRAANISRHLPIISSLTQMYRLNSRNEDTSIKIFTDRTISSTRFSRGRESDCTMKQAALQTRSWLLENSGKRKEH